MPYETGHTATRSMAAARGRMVRQCDRESVPVVRAEGGGCSRGGVERYLEFWSCVRLVGCSRNSHEPIPFTTELRDDGPTRVVRELLGQGIPRGVAMIGEYERAEVERGPGVTATTEGR